MIYIILHEKCHQKSMGWTLYIVSIHINYVNSSLSSRLYFTCICYSSAVPFICVWIYLYIPAGVTFLYIKKLNWYFICSTTYWWLWLSHNRLPCVNVMLMQFTIYVHVCVGLYMHTQLSQGHYTIKSFACNHANTIFLKQKLMLLEILPHVCFIIYMNEWFNSQIIWVPLGFKLILQAIQVTINMIRVLTNASKGNNARGKIHTFNPNETKTIWVK